MSGWFWDYFVTPQGFEIRLFRFLLIYRLRRDQIVRVHIIDGMFNFGALMAVGWHPWNTISLGNRWRRRWILLEKKWWPRFLAISPNNAELFAEELEKMKNSS